MSDIRFQTQDGFATLSAAERARAATLVDDLALGLLAPHRPAVARRLHQLLRPDHVLRTVPVDEPRWVEEYRAAFTGHVDAGLVCPDGRTVDTFALALNTAVLVGGAPVRLLAWLHAECEAHGYLEPDQSGWVGGVIEEGLGTGLLRAGAGWDAVLSLLRKASGPVVLSVAGHGEFAGGPTGQTLPPWQAAPGEGERRVGRGVAPPAATGWGAALTALRADPSVVPLDPGTLRRPYGHGLTVLDLVAPDSEQRLSRLTAAPSAGAH